MCEILLYVDICGLLSKYSKHLCNFYGPYFINGDANG